MSSLSRGVVFKFWITLGVVASTLFTLPTAYAYRAARVAVDQADLKDASNPDANTKSTLPRGTRVNTSDQPTNGYYRVRSATDSGWVRGDDLNFSGPPIAANKSAKRSSSRRQSGPDESSWSAKIFAGFDFFSPSALETQFQTTALGTGAGFGGELDYWWNKDWALAFRIESIGKSTNGPAGPSANADVLDVNVGSTPVMGGILYSLSKGDTFSFDAAAYLGLGFGTNVTETDTNQTAPNITEISGTAPTFLLAVDGNWHVTEPLWIYAELGYRYLSTGSSTPSTVSNGKSDTLFENASTGAFVPLAINLSGVIFNIGARINF